MRRRISSSPDWNGMWKNWHILGSSAHAFTKRSVKYLPPHSRYIRLSTSFYARTCFCVPTRFNAESPHMLGCA